MKSNTSKSNNCDCMNPQNSTSKNAQNSTERETICVCAPKECDCTITESNQSTKSKN